MKAILFIFTVVSVAQVAPALHVVSHVDDWPAVNRAAENLKKDLLAACPSSATDSREILVGTLGRSPAIDSLVAAGKLEVSAIRGRWEASIRAYVDGRWVVAGADRRGTVYGIYQISSELGVSPFTWWDDIPVVSRATFNFSTNTLVIASPAVKYRGLFINDEDWGLRPWTKNNFEKDSGGTIGVRTYEKIFEMMLRCRLNLIWPAMHECTYEFCSRPENMRLADEMGIVVGTSHCEPMLRNNCFWKDGDWDYRTNKEKIDAYWQWSASHYGSNEVLWTLGMRGKHDAALKGGKNPRDKIAIVEDCIATQTNLIRQYVQSTWGEPAMNFVPYKEVLDLYNKGLSIPSAATVMWVNDNFGYIRRLGGPAEKHKGGMYWHVSYFGSPHSYTHLCSTPPGFMWYELGAKCAANDVREIWVVNVGDVKPADVLIRCLGKIAWNPAAYGPDAQGKLLLEWAAEFVGPEHEELARRIARHLAEYYNLGMNRKPEHLSMQWVAGLSSASRQTFAARYAALFREDEAIEAALPPASRDAWFNAFGFAARFFAQAGMLFMSPELMNPEAQAATRQAVAALTARYDSLFNGKWKGFWCDTTVEKKSHWNNGFNRWSSQMQWPWNEPQPPRKGSITAGDAGVLPGDWRAAADFMAKGDVANGGWQAVEGLGCSGRAMALLPVAVGKGAGAWLDYSFACPHGGPAKLVLQFLPDYRLYPGLRLRVRVQVNGGAESMVEVPGSDGKTDEKGKLRSAAVLDNFIRASVPVSLQSGTNIIRLLALDPGLTLDGLGIHHL